MTMTSTRTPSTQTRGSTSAAGAMGCLSIPARGRLSRSRRATRWGPTTNSHRARIVTPPPTFLPHPQRGSNALEDRRTSIGQRGCGWWELASRLRGLRTARPLAEGVHVFYALPPESQFLDGFLIGVSRGETPRVADQRFHLDVGRMRRKCLMQGSCGDQNTLRI